MKINSKFISVIITTKNEEDNIENCLRSIIEQSYPRDLIEIIVVDNYSTDRTIEIAHKYADIVDTIGPERNTQRNHGMMSLSSAKYLMWIDADMILSRNLIENSLSFLSNSAHVALYIPEIIVGDDFFSRVRRFERSFYDNTVIDGSRIMQRDVFIQAGGFSNEWQHGPDDWDLDKSIKLIGSIGYLQCYENYPTSILEKLDLYFLLTNQRQSVIFHNESRLSIFKFIQKKAYYANDFGGYINKWGRGDPDIKKQIGISYRFFYVFFENGKWKRVINRPDLYICIIFIRGLTGIAYILSRLGLIK